MATDELDPKTVSAVANSNFKAISEIPTQLANVLSNDIVTLARNANSAAVQTASDSRSVHASAMGVLAKRICEHDAAESAALFSTQAHTNRMAVTSAAGADSAQVAQSLSQLGTVSTQLSQLNQLIAALISQKGS
tara:strand:- start:5 stop:409 length:405 start_codon:yes stop_codon:yes gene_type:complete